MSLRSTECFSLSKKWLLSGIATSLMLSTVPVQAATIQAKADWSLNSITGAASPDIDGPATSGSVDILNTDNDGFGNDVFYHTYGDVTGNFGSRVSGNGDYDITGLFTYKETFVNPNPFPSPASFSFTIVPGELSGFLSPDYMPTAGEALSARYEIDIRLNGTSIWDSSAILVYDGGTNMVSFMDTGTTSLGGTLTGNSYTFGPYSDTISLGTFAAGETFLLEYDLKTIAAGNLPTTCIGGGGGGGDNGGGEGDPGRGESAIVEPGNSACGGSTARSGDPFDLGLGNTGTVTGAVPATTPEPGNLLSFLALGSAIGGSSILRWHRQKKGSAAKKNSNS